LGTMVKLLVELVLGGGRDPLGCTLECFKKILGLFFKKFLFDEHGLGRK